MRILIIISLFIGWQCSNKSNLATTVNNTTKEETVDKQNTSNDLTKIVKTDEEWKSVLNEQEYYVIREKGTERPFTGELLNNKKKGVYTCKACQLPLFESSTKFKSGTGWPSFYAPINDVNVAEEKDVSYGMVRTEVLCGRCDGHLGHVFNDGPRPTGMRYCINSVSLDFEEKTTKKDDN